MLIPDRLSALIHEIYDAAGGNRQWSEALDRVSAALGAGAICLNVYDIRKRTATVWRYARIGSDEIQQYERHYSAKSPYMRPGHPAYDDWVSSRRVGRGEEICPLSELRKSEFYTWARRSDAVYLAAVPLGFDRKKASLCVLSRPESMGPHSDEAVQALGWLAPHLRRAMDWCERTREAQAAALALDVLCQPAFLLNRQGYILHMNAAGQRITHAGQLLRIGANGKLELGDTAAAGTLCRRLRESRGECWVSLPTNTKSGKAPSLSVLPLGGGSECLRSGPAAILVRLHDPASETMVAVETFASRFGLSKAERRLLQYVADGLDLQRAADKANLSRNTVKTQMAAIFAKTGLHNRPQLLRAVFRSEPRLV